MIFIRCVSLVIASLLLVVSVASANQFTVSQVVIDSLDTDPPSAPLNVTATAASSDQIDLAWDASSDNVSVVGYRVYRDGVGLATTSSATYVDTGLAAGTSYAYTVRAFDGAINLSAHSATATAMTDNLPSESVTPKSAIGGMALSKVNIVDLRIAPVTNGAQISFSTDRPTRVQLSWGEGADAELGALAERTFAETHDTFVPGLAPDTTYTLRIRVIDRSGVVTTEVHTFKTMSLTDTTAPANVSLLSGIAEGEGALLTWKNPQADFSHVRIVRSDGGYPSDPHDGVLVYEGADESFKDQSSLKDISIRYYAVFAYDQAGNPASGAVVRVVKDGAIIPTPEVSPYAAPFAFEDMTFLQNGMPIEFLGSEITIDASMPLSLEINYERLPEHLKSIVVHLQDPENPNRIFSFLLRVNADKTKYVATIDALVRNGSFPLTLQILDYKERSISTIEGTVHTHGAPTSQELVPVLSILNKGYVGTALALMLLLISLYAILSVRVVRKHYASL